MKVSSIVLTASAILGAYFWWQPSAWHQLKNKAHTALNADKPTDAIKKLMPRDKTEAAQEASTPQSQVVYRYQDRNGQFAYSTHPPKGRPSTALTLHSKEINTIDYSVPDTADDEKKKDDKIENPYALSEEQKKLLNPVDRMRLESAEIQYQMQAKREKMIDEVVNN